MANTTLKAEVRSGRGSRRAGRLRESGSIPGILYGHKVEPVLLALSGRDFLAAVRGKRMVDLDIGGRKETALIKEVQYDALGREIVHVDFHRIAMDELITIEVPVILKGRPAGVEAGGFLDQPVKKVKVQCLPANIPEKLTAEVSPLQIGESVLAKDLLLPENVQILEAPDRLIASVVPPHAEAPVEGAVEAAPSEPEVIRPEKKAEGEEEAEGKEKPAKEKPAKEKEKA